MTEKLITEVNFPKCIESNNRNIGSELGNIRKLPFSSADVSTDTRVGSIGKNHSTSETSWFDNPFPKAFSNIWRKIARVFRPENVYD